MSDQDARASQLAAERANQTDPDPEPLECLDESPLCHGNVEHRMALSGTGVSYPRCDFHWDKRLAKQEEINLRYPPHPPADWSPDDAGEAWYEEEDY
jgi:hypothetical protein